ncbi:glycosyltransferase BC10-like [Rutidosis leptorrhynchoides]|uniref:glycosyltransferase BC10-like n=1 Tax=Rutidosis leptorrhynchoides TaxID=125765 RepID=UPI003A9A151A
MSPTPLSLLCALLLTLPLAIVFTINTDTTTTATVSPPIPTVHFHRPISPPHQKLIKNTTSLIEDIDQKNDENSYEKLLLQMAGEVNKKPSPTSSPKKLAFMFLTVGSLPMAPLWELYFNRTKRKNLYNIYIHANPNLRHDLIFQGVFTNRTIPSKLTRRHTPSLAAAHRRLLAHALLNDPLKYMFILLSPSCIPIHSFDFTYKTLIKSKKSFVEILENEPGAWGRWAARGDSVMAPEVEFDMFRIGSQFSVLTRQHAMVAVSDTRVWSKFKLPCLKENRYRCYPEENYLPTLLSMVDTVGCVPATLTFVEWKGRYDGHPHTFHAQDVGPELIRTIRGRRPRYGDEQINGSDVSLRKRNDPFLFARKFGSDTVGALMDIANDVILRD